MGKDKFPSRVYQERSSKAVVYQDTANQNISVLYGGAGKADGPGHGHVVYSPTKDRVTYDRPPKK